MNLMVMENRGKKKACKDKTKVFLPACKGSIMVVMNKKEITGGNYSYEAKMKSESEALKLSI